MSIAMPHLNGTYPWQNQSTAQNQNTVSTTLDIAPIVASPVASLTKSVTSLTKDVQQTKVMPEPEVEPRAKRRTFTQKYKDNILQQAQGCTGHGQMGALLRREGLYSSHLTDWKRKQQMQEQQLNKQHQHNKLDKNNKVDKATSSPKMVLPNKMALPLAQQNRELRRKAAQLERQLAQAQALLDLQKKVSQLLGITLETPEEDS